MTVQAFRARRILSLAGEAPAAGPEAAALLDAPHSVMHDAVLLVRGGRVQALESYAAYKRNKDANTPLTDLGEVCLAPGLVNAHCHLELSHLHGKTLSAKGFGAWMQSLVTALSLPVSEDEKEAAVARALQALHADGAAHVGDVGSRSPALIARLARAVPAPVYPLTHFLEVFGFTPPACAPMPSELDAKGYTPAPASDIPAPLREHCAVSGHALYSTGPEALRAALDWCEAAGRVFSLHLAESEEEDQCLLQGKGPLHELLGIRVLPKDWNAPGLSPVRSAHSLGLLTPRTLAVHCVRCNEHDAALLAEQGVCVCLCPKSNEYIGVGTAPAMLLAKKGALLCLGTDSLSSNTCLSIREEMARAQALYNFSPRAVLRMATINGAKALRLPHLGSLQPGRAASFSLWDVRAFD